MITGCVDSKCCKCDKHFCRSEMIRVKDEEYTRVWGIITHILLTPCCRHDEYMVLPK